MSPSRPATAKRLPRLSTSLSVPVDSGREPRSSYPSSSAAVTVTSVRAARISSLRGAVGPGFLHDERLEVLRAIDGQVVLRHPRGGPPLLGELADPLAVEELVRHAGGRHHLGRVVADDAGDAVFHDLRYRSARGAQHWDAAEHGLDHHQ